MAVLVPRGPIRVGAAVFVLGVVAGVFLLLAPSSSSTGRPVPADGVERYALPGPDGAPLLDDCGVPIRLSAEEFFAAVSPPERAGARATTATETAVLEASRAAVTATVAGLDFESVAELDAIVSADTARARRIERQFRAEFARQLTARGLRLPVARPAVPAPTAEQRAAITAYGFAVAARKHSAC